MKDIRTVSKVFLIQPRKNLKKQTLLGNEENQPYSSVPRNPLIVHIFYLAGLIEEMGTGIGRIMEAMEEAGLPEPEFKEEMGGFSVYFRKDIYTEEYLRKLGLNERQIKAVMYVKEKGK